MKKRIISLALALAMLMALLAPLSVSAEGGAQGQVYYSDEPITGDVNDDGKVNLKDVVSLYRYIIGAEVEIIEKALDVDGDGEVSIFDAFELFHIETGHNAEGNPAHVHKTVRIAPKSPTVTEKGNIEYYYCSGCGVCFSDSAAQNEITADSTLIDAMYSRGLVYALNEDGESYSVAGIGTCTDTHVVIPSTYEGKPVTVIKAQSFACNTVESVYIPPSIEYIENNAFTSCTNLKEVHISDLKAWCEIDFSAYMGNPLYNAHNLYLNGQLVTELVIPDGVTSLDRTFAGCTNITSVQCPDSMLYIGTHAFMNCSALTSINIPKNVWNVNGWTFVGCSSLNDISVSSENQYYTYKDGCLIEIGTKTLVWGNYDCIIPSDGSVTAIGEFAFAEREKLTGIVIPEGVTSIGSYAFAVCTNIESFVYNGTEEDWKKVSKGSQWKNGCTFTVTFTKESEPNTGSQGLEFTLNSDGNSYSVTGIGTCTDTDIIIPTTYNDLPVTSIGDSAFENCSKLTSINIPNGVISIGSHAFFNCLKLTSVNIPNSVTSIGDYAFVFCESLIGINIPNSVTSIGIQAFGYCSSLTSITIPNGVTSIGMYAFSDCSGLESIVVAEGNTVYHSYQNCLIETASKTLMAGCQNSIIPADGSVTRIEDSAFSSCSKLTSINIPNGVTDIGMSAFYGCSSLTSIIIPISVTNIERYAFSDCSKLESLVVEEGNTRYHSDNNCIIYTYAKELVVGCKSSVIPTDGSVTSIGHWAFYDCRSLTSITIPNSVTSIGDMAFRGCSNLTSINISEGVTSIGFYAFSGCYKLTSITIPNSITFLDYGAFNYCENLSTFIFDGTAEEWEKVEKETDWTIECPFTEVIFTKESGHSHSLVHVPAVAPTCTVAGNIEYWYCSGCDWLERENGIATNRVEVTLPTSHTPGDWIIDKEATNTENGSKHKECSVCKETVETEIIPYTGSIGLVYELNEDGESYALVGMGTCTDTDLYIQEVYDGKPVTTIKLSYEDAEEIESVHIPASITHIEDGGFVIYVDNVYIVDLPAWCYITYKRATVSSSSSRNIYLNGQLLTDLVIPEGVLSIAFHAFCACDSIKSITIPASVTYIYDSAFQNCSNISDITVAEGNQYYSSSGNCLIDTRTKTLVAGCNNSVIPADGSVVKIGWDAFSRRRGLVTITIPNSVTTISYWAFADCSDLIAIELPNGVTSIEGFAFQNCTNLESVTIPNSITSIGTYAFVDCYNITSFVFDGTEEEWNKVTKEDGWNSGCTFTVTFTKETGN